MTTTAPPSPRPKPLRWAAALWLLMAPLGWAMFVGCQRSNEIRQYQVPKTPPTVASGAEADPAPPSETTEATDRMLGAIIPRGGQVWFFKLAGPKDAVSAEADAFEGLVKSVHFPPEAAGEPRWTLPEGWRQQPGSQLRFATLLAGPQEKPLETTVTVLGMPEGAGAEYILANVNRWRDQISLPPIGLPAMEKQARQIPLDGATATLVDLQGRLKGGMGTPPFFRGAGNGQ